MGWAQEDINYVYKEVKDAVSALHRDNPYWSAGQIKNAAKTRLKYRFGYRDYRGWKSHGYGLSNKKYKRFIKSKYYDMGLPSKEKIMLDKMIDTVIDGLECNDSSFTELTDVISKLDVMAHRAKTINDDCDSVITELNKICASLEDGECND